MGKTPLQLTLAISCLCLLWISGLGSVPSRYSLGIDPRDQSYYKSNVIKCKDGSKKFTIDQLNDEFCDCADGTDEPGTSACPEGKFYCQNAGHIPLTIFSSRVNDGLCDCCDGSDEYDGNVNCPNTCWEAGKAAREKLIKKIKTYQEGVTIRKKEIEKAKQAYTKDEEDLSKLKNEEKILKDLVDKLKDHKERIEKEEKRLREAAEEERLKKEKEEMRLKAAEDKANDQEKLSEKVPTDPTDGVHGGSAEQDISNESHGSPVEVEKDHHLETEFPADFAVEPHVAEEDDVDDTYRPEVAGHSTSSKEASSDVANQNVAKGDTLQVDESDDEIGNSESDASHIRKQEQEGSDDISGLSKDDVGRIIASRWTGKNAAHKPDDAGSSTKDEVPEDIPDSGEEDDNGYNSETDDDKHKYDDDDFEDDADREYTDDPIESDTSYNPHDDADDDFPDMIDSNSSSWLGKIKHTVHNVLSSFNFFKTPVDLSEADRVKKEYEESKSKLSKIQSRISSLTEKLKHDFGTEKEFYSFYGHCFENKQSKYVYKVCPFKQASQVEGHSSTGLGNWEKFDESYRMMHFSRGDKCWSGPDRSLKVRLRCGLTNELTDVDEPSRCEYVALLSTPSLCTEDRLKELQQKLEQMNTRREPENHDEL